MTTTITTRAGKGNPLTHDEVDANFVNLKATADSYAASGGAALIRNTPAGNIAATTVQAALNELDTEKAPTASPTFTGPVNFS